MYIFINLTKFCYLEFKYLSMIKFFILLENYNSKGEKCENFAKIFRSG